MECCAFFFKTVNSSVLKIRSLLRLDDSENIKKSTYWVAKFCDFLVYMSIAYFTFCQFCYILPFQIEAIWNEESVLLMVLYVLLQLAYFYVIFSCTFHYYKAKTVKPVAQPGTTCDYFCKSCQNWKCQMTFHCKACDKCIYLMDHHCPWIGQCVGAHNQAHFFLFLFHMFLINLCLIPASYPYFANFYETISVNVERFRAAKMCSICGRGYLLMMFNTTAENCWISLLIAYFFLVLFLIAFFLAVYSWRISFGNSHLSRKSFNRKRIGTVQKLVTRWRTYFDTRDDEHFYENFLFPRNRRPIQHGDCLDEEEKSLL